MKASWIFPTQIFVIIAMASWISNWICPRENITYTSIRQKNLDIGDMGPFLPGSTRISPAGSILGSMKEQDSPLSLGRVEQRPNKCKTASPCPWSYTTDSDRSLARHRESIVNFSLPSSCHQYNTIVKPQTEPCSVTWIFRDLVPNFRYIRYSYMARLLETNICKVW